ncbi:hypothetical protein Acr_00g0050500 [Actinidia rufa]|uniref:Uncharacterized protein n=1 Tax=Actinidia rufa TaxID=165716 RepID=A0A7J0DKN5_9ERIC|nr:hypothetical protein Acr_00g0050500 [Actinidia rufa]
MRWCSLKASWWWSWCTGRCDRNRVRVLMINHSLLASLLRLKLSKSLTKCRQRMTMKKRSSCMLIIKRKSHEKVVKTRAVLVEISKSLARFETEVMKLKSQLILIGSINRYILPGQIIPNLLGNIKWGEERMDGCD